MKHASYEHARRVAGSVSERVASMTDDERMEFWRAVREGYCDACGRRLATHDDVCHCWNDE